ncbi:hypothetical protein C7S18_17900 [Ahniella affigens]|uniref:Uncharacterized protein n=1 Tax=Ahniella affigens TaxID=2021234 RepID=A0A2P1PVQ3_9GAMM|nr:hypothetical protein [Ahniella affigens]AVP98935.1 hypothetical protein C7S18_17900 [Ahniella affigens]
MDELEYRRLLKKLPERIEPQRDLWSGIEARLVDPAKRPLARQPFPFAIAASLLTAVLLGAWVLGQSGVSNQTPETANASLAQTNLPNLVRARQAMMLESAAAWNEISSHDERTLMQSANPEVFAAWLELDGAETELEAALKSAPQAEFLLVRLKHVELEKLKLARLAASV